MKHASVVIAFALAALVAPGQSAAQTCGSVLLIERSAPVAFQGITLGVSTMARYWAAGSGGTTFNGAGCAVGCTSFSASPVCAGNGNCIGLTGVNWLNGSTCATGGLRPSRTIFVVETTTASSGGLWGAFNLAKDSADANYDLDARAASACSGCSSTASPYIGGVGQPITINSTQMVGGNVVVNLSWLPPGSAVEALNDSGSTTIKSYSVFYARAVGGVPPQSTGTKTAWTRVDDTDGARIAGYSTDTNAVVTINPQGSTEDIYLALGLNFDGTGNPTADPNTKESSYVSARSPAVAVASCATDTSAPAVVPPATVTVTQTLCQ